MKEFLNFNSGKISWFRCGGRIASYCIVENVNELNEALEKYSQYKDNLLVIGAGSNMLIRDGGFDGLAIKLTGEFNTINIKNKSEKEIYLTAGAGVFDKQVASFALEHNLIGCEFLDTIPGTIGGAVKMNAGCFGKEVKDVLVSAKILTNGAVVELTNEDLCFSYRKSKIPDNAVILEATFLLQKVTNEQIVQSDMTISEMRKKRKENQIVGATCGSTFANPMAQNGEKLSAWKLIDEVGMRGFAVGGAKFSEKHCNFLINTGKATAKDIEELIFLAKQKVKEKFNIELHEEIKIFGNQE